jgi:hypothetical protein
MTEGTAMTNCVETTARWRAFQLLGDVLQFSVMCILLDRLLFSGVPLVLTLRVGVVVTLLVGALRWNGWPILVAIQVSLWLREPGNRPWVPTMETFLVCVVSLVFVAYFYCSNKWQRQFGRWFADSMIRLMDSANQVAGTGNVSGAQRHASFSNVMRFAIGQSLLLIGIVLLAMLLMTLLPASTQMRSWWLFQQSIESDYILWPGATLVIVLVALWVVMRETAWKQMSAAQANLYLRSSFLMDHFPDLRMIVLKGLKIRRKVADSVASVKTTSQD